MDSMDSMNLSKEDIVLLSVISRASEGEKCAVVTKSYGYGKHLFDMIIRKLPTSMIYRVVQSSLVIEFKSGGLINFYTLDNIQDRLRTRKGHTISLIDIPAELPARDREALLEIERFVARYFDNKKITYYSTREGEYIDNTR